MKNKLSFAVVIILTFFVGCAGMYLLISKEPLKTEVVQKVMNEYQVEETATTDAIDKAYDGVVVVESYKNDELIGSGTGFVYKSDDKYGYIITNAHVIDSGNKMNIIFSNNKSVTATLLGKDIYADIAVLSVPVSDNFKVVQIGSSENMKLGSTVFTVGAPLGSDYSGTVTKGILSGKDRIISVNLTEYGNDDWMMRVLQTDAAINPGNSGGPLINLAGEVIGINSSKLVENEVEGMGFAIPIEDAMQYVSDLEKGKIISRPMLGVELVDLNEMYTLFLNNITVDKNVKSGVVIAKVEQDSPADKIKLQKGDIIQKIGDKEVDNKAQLRYELYKHKVGEAIKITVYRDSKTKEYEVTLGDSNG